MTKQYFKCTLISDVVFNASLATEGNMQSLDYIPGSNFLGIAAKALYGKFKGSQNAYTVFHSGKVSFGDALIAVGDAQSYAMPFVLFQDKLNNGISEYPTRINPYQIFPKKGIQWEQHRDGFINSDKIYIKEVEKKFLLKSAYDAKERRSKDGAMYGFDSLRKGQTFIFSVDFDEDIDASIKQEVIDALIGKKRVGKSKSAQYGQVRIEKISVPNIFGNGAPKDKQLWIYAESNLCFLNEYGQATFQPSAKDFGISGTINWEQSQIRNYSYSPWNTHRNTTNTQRDCILKGSVIVFDLDNEVNPQSLAQKVGGYQEEGLGRVIYNPAFLAHDNGLWAYSKKLTKYEKVKLEPSSSHPIQTDLGKFLLSKNKKAEKEFKIGQAVQDFLRKHRIDKPKLTHITSSQWGVVRNEAIHAKTLEDLKKTLVDEKTGKLTNGVAFDRYWSKNGQSALKKLKEALSNNELGKKYIAKLATEMAKETQRESLKPKENEVHA